MKIREAAAYFPASLLEQPKQLLVTSQVELHHPALQTDRLLSLRHIRPIERNQARLLGISSNLVALIPATVDSFSVSVDFLVDSQNLLAKLGRTINEGQFLKELTLVPDIQAIAGTVSKIAGGLVKAFLKEEEQKPLLQFSGSFNLVREGLREGFYVILGSLDPNFPLPTASVNSQFLIPVNGGLILNGQPVEKLSYVILEVCRADNRTAELNNGALWNSKLREAKAVEDKIRLALNQQKINEYREQWGNLIEAFALLLRNDFNYLEQEADEIIAANIESGLKKFKDASNSFGRLEISSLGGDEDEEEGEWEEGLKKHLLPKLNVELEVVADQYRLKEENARKELAELGLLNM
ncbi:MAG: hypothetical protein HXX08_15010 [Chloroflexi bacterium]|uniref:Uncharacterized protein n=1 Tax=Candidatus Chlorohelix allophototropha TaxID=3003348 RepID=A0A8T7M527_9CHLR|nr:hypothetical protein [Chloroflexota bacterium]WJW69080.1 hypothetical protein OZ401_002673 [Chloroflexota bacterium L227-S17]